MRRFQIPIRLVDVYTSSGSNLYSRSSYPDYFDLRDSGTFASLMAYTEVSITMDANGQPEPLTGELVSGNYFDVLGVAMAVGRGFAPDEDQIGAPVRVAIISHALWQRVFNGDQSLIGQTVRLNSDPYTLIGVAPPGFCRSASLESRRTYGFPPRFSPKWIRRQRPCGAPAVIPRSSTCAVQED